MTPGTEEINWEAEITVRIPQDCPDPTISRDEWLQALLRDGAGLESWLQDPGGTHHDTHHGHPVGYRFKFMPGPQDFITARGSCHPACEHLPGMLIDISRRVSNAEILIRFHNPQARRKALETLGATAQEIEEATGIRNQEPEMMEISGTLLTMDATGMQDPDFEMEIRMVEETPWAVTHHKIQVPMGLGDCVAPLWGMEAVATVQREKDRLVLLEIAED